MSDNISTNTVYHFTRSMENLESILINDFYPRYCVENFLGIISGSVDAEKAVPMVSFCDIPLSQVRKHIKTYGEYAIGLSKEWAIEKKINPVLYTYPNSDFSNNTKKVFSALVEHEDSTGGDNSMIHKLISAIQYVKPYEGKLWQNGCWSKETIRFYDEREWRYIPKFPTKNNLGMIRKEPGENYADIIKEFNVIISDKKIYNLSFQPKDIRFIIVKKENEILPMLDKVINIKREKFSYKDVQILTTRIISMDCIKENF